MIRAISSKFHQVLANLCLAYKTETIVRKMCFIIELMKLYTLKYEMRKYIINVRIHFCLYDEK